MEHTSKYKTMYNKPIANLIPKWEKQLSNTYIYTLVHNVRVHNDLHSYGNLLDNIKKIKKPLKTCKELKPSDFPITGYSATTTMITAGAAWSECLPTMHKALGSVSSNTPPKQKSTTRESITCNERNHHSIHLSYDRHWEGKLFIFPRLQNILE